MADVVIERSVIFGDATCPSCGTLIWFIHAADTTKSYVTNDTQIVRDRVNNYIADQLGVDRECVANNPFLKDGSRGF